MDRPGIYLDIAPPLPQGLRGVSLEACVLSALECYIGIGIKQELVQETLQAAANRALQDWAFANDCDCTGWSSRVFVQDQHALLVRWRFADVRGLTTALANLRASHSSPCVVFVCPFGVPVSVPLTGALLLEGVRLARLTDEEKEHPYVE